MSGQHLLRIVNDVLNLSQLNNSDARAIQPLNLSHAIAQPLRMLREIAKTENITIRYADHEEQFRAGDAYYIRPGHLPKTTAGSEIVEFTPTAKW